MALRDVGDLLIYLGAVCAALAAIGVLLRWGAVRPLKRWIVEQIRPALAQVEPNGGSQQSTRHLIEQTALQTEQLVGRLDELAETAAENRKLATEALAVSREALATARGSDQRLDRHLTGHGG